MSNLDLWGKVKSVPQAAIKGITGGRLKGMSDINPMWRLKTLTEQFGICGVGWKYKIIEKRLEAGANNEVAAFVDIELYVKVNGEWSDAIPGTGGSSFVAKETKGLYTSDECFKMALTDAISVACKALGIGADIYWDKDKTKYSGRENQPEKDTPKNQPKASDIITVAQARRLFAISNGNTDLVRSAIGEFGYTSSKEIKTADYDKICKIIEDKA